MGLAPFLSEEVKLLLGLLGLSIIVVSAATWLVRVFADGLQGAGFIQSGPAYWTLTETITWVAFGETITTKGWSALVQKLGFSRMEQRHRFYVAERSLFEKLRDPESGIDIQGRDGGEGLHQPIPPSVFLSNVGASVLDDTIGMPHEAGLDDILNWKGPKWTDVRIRRAHILQYWRDRLPIPTVAEELGQLILEARSNEQALQDHDARPPTDAMQRWFSRVTEYVRNNMGREYEARFTRPQTFTDEELGPLGRHQVNVLKVGLQRRITLLHQFIERLTQNEPSSVSADVDVRTCN
jgi:hypothetical protein